MPPRPSAPSVWLYLPNLIGYARVVTILGAAACGTDAALTTPFFLLYAVSYLLDAFDGPAARYLGQTSRFGAVLDMVTDRVSTALLLGVEVLEGVAGAEAAALLLLVLGVPAADAAGGREEAAVEELLDVTVGEGVTVAL